MRRILAVLFILSLANVSFAQKFDFNQGEPDTTAYFFKIPYTYENNKLIVQAKVGGKIRNFILSTGTVTCISQQLADELQLDTKEEIYANNLEGKRGLTPIVTLNNLLVGTVTFNNVPSFVFNSPNFFSCFNVDGLIGSNLFYNSIIQLSSEDSTALITNQLDSLTLHKKHATKLSVDNEHGLPYISVKSGSSKVELLVDTYTEDFMSMGIADYDRLKGGKSFRLLGSTYKDASEEAINTVGNLVHRLFMPAITLAKHKFANAIVQTTAEPSKLGSAIVKHGKVTVDYINKQLYFEPNNADYAYSNVKEKLWTISPSFKDGGLIVGTVWDNLGQNINQGDIIIAIDGVSSQNISYCDILTNSILSRKRNEALLTIEQKDGVRRNVKIIKQ